MGLMVGAAAPFHRAADALGSAFFSLDDISRRRSHNQQNDCDENKIHHNPYSFREILFSCGTQGIFRSQAGIGLFNEINYDTHHSRYGDQTGNKAGANGACGQQCADLVN